MGCPDRDEALLPALVRSRPDAGGLFWGTSGRGLVGGAPGSLADARPMPDRATLGVAGGRRGVDPTDICQLGRGRGWRWLRASIALNVSVFWVGFTPRLENVSCVCREGGRDPPGPSSVVGPSVASGDVGETQLSSNPAPANRSDKEAATTMPLLTEAGGSSLPDVGGPGGGRGTGGGGNGLRGAGFKAIHALLSMEMPGSEDSITELSWLVWLGWAGFESFSSFSAATSLESRFGAGAGREPVAVVSSGGPSEWLESNWSALTASASSSSARSPVEGPSAVEGLCTLSMLGFSCIAPVRQSAMLVANRPAVRPGALDRVTVLSLSRDAGDSMPAEAGRSGAGDVRVGDEGWPVAADAADAGGISHDRAGRTCPTGMVANVQGSAWGSWAGLARVDPERARGRLFVLGGLLDLLDLLDAGLHARERSDLVATFLGQRSVGRPW